jgi:hypothetical protein
MWAGDGGVVTSKFNFLSDVIYKRTHQTKLILNNFFKTSDTLEILAINNDYLNATLKKFKKHYQNFLNHSIIISTFKKL